MARFAIVENQTLYSGVDNIVAQLQADGYDDPNSFDDMTIVLKTTGRVDPFGNKEFNAFVYLNETDVRLEDAIQTF